MTGNFTKIKFFVNIISYLTIPLSIFICTGIEGADMNLKNLEGFKVRGAADIDPYCANGDAFVEDSGKLYILLWKRVDGNTGASDTIIASTNLGENRWSKKNIPGKAYFLRIHNNNRICSIKQGKNNWSINLYNSTGNRISSSGHPFQKQDQELYHFIPVPILYSENSLLLYSMYMYETRNRIAGFFLSLISGGHGWKPKIGEYAEIINLDYGSPTDKISFSYSVIIDSTLRRTVVEDALKFENSISDTKIEESTYKNYSIKRYEMINQNINFYYKDGLIIEVSSNIRCANKEGDYRILASLPPFPVKDYINEVVGHLGSEQLSDILIDDADNVYYAFYHKSMKDNDKCVLLFFYNQTKKKWTTSRFRVNIGLGIDSICAYLSRNDYYLGIKRYPNEFYVIKCDKNEFKHGVDMNIEWGENRR